VRDVTFDEFFEEVRRRVEVGAAEAKIPYEYNGAARAWKREALTVSVALDPHTGQATTIASRQMSKLFGAGSSAFIPQRLDEDGIEETVKVILDRLDDPYAYG
jgi:hypothetical protein